MSDLEGEQDKDDIPLDRDSIVDEEEAVKDEGEDEEQKSSHTD